MQIFLAGATGVLGTRLVLLLVERGHQVTGMTRSPNKTDLIRRLGGHPVVCDAFDADAVKAVIAASSPEVVIDELTDLPDERSRMPEHRERNDRMRREGIRALIAAIEGTGARLVSQSIAWTLDGDAQAAVEDHERQVLDANGVLVRYGQLYGPGTFYPDAPPEPPRIHVDTAASRTLDALDAAPRAILNIYD